MCAIQTKESDESAINLSAELVALHTLSIPGLQQYYETLFGRSAPTTHRAFLLRRVAWEVQARRTGDLSAEATDRLAELVDAMNPLAEAVIAASRRSNLNTLSTAAKRCRRSVRRPQPGTMIQRVYRGRQILVRVRESDFEYDGRRYRSLSAIAKVITGAHWNGWLFFGLTRQKRTV